ncbi:hypothetical protein BH09PAT3_BH09PAT3_5670 [soil metagenome]
MNTLDNSTPQTKPVVIDCGLLSDLQWRGGVSAKGMVDSSFTTIDAIAAAAQSVNDYYVTVDETAPTRCIDGRHNPGRTGSDLGAQVPGGAPGAALAYRLGVDQDDLTRGTFLADAEAMIGHFIRLGFAPGGHRDENSANSEAVGCGAIDGMDKILAIMTEPSLVNDHKRVVKLLMGNDFYRDDYLRVLGAAVTVNGHAHEYFLNREKVIDALEERAKKSIVTLKGDHQECVVVVNLVPGTTLSSNQFSDAFGGIQAFGYDLWRSKQMASKLLPRPEQLIDRQRFVMARVMTTVATLMALTDGSQRLLLRVEEPVEEEPLLA